MQGRAMAIGGHVTDLGPLPATDTEYRPFPDVQSRNAWQEALEVPALVLSLRVPEGGRVLEVGCGRGVALPPLARWLRPRRFIGLDVDASLLAQADARVRGQRLAVELLVGDLRRLPLPDGSLDLVIDFGTCYHVSRQAQALREIARVIAVGGRFVYESRLNQLLAHPVRSRGRCLPWRAVPELALERHALLWASRVKTGTR